MIKSKYKNIIESDGYDSNILYLVEKITEEYGIFVYDSKIVFVAISYDEETRLINTEYVSFKQHVYLNSAINHPSFKKGYYDILIFNGDINSEFFESFYRLCSSFPLSYSEMSFKEFFYGLTELLSMPSEKKYLNLIGLMGELFFIKQAYELNKTDLSSMWHTTGKGTDKYDFVLSDSINVEIKTTASDSMSFKIKHRQVFNEKNNYICLVKIMPDNSGDSLNKLIQYFLSKKPFSTNIGFLFALEQEIVKTNKSQRDLCFSVDKIQFFNNRDLSTLNNIPDCISNVEYDYDFSNLKGIPLIKFDFNRFKKV